MVKRNQFMSGKTAEVDQGDRKDTYFYPLLPNRPYLLSPHPAINTSV